LQIAWAKQSEPSLFLGSWPKSATEVEGFWIQQVGGAAAGVNPRSI